MALFSNPFKKQAGSVLGIDIGSSAIKIVQVTKKNSQAVLETYGELALGPYGGNTIGQSVVLSPAQIAKALNDLMKEKEVNVTTNRCGLSIPFGSALMSVMEMPAVSEKQLSVMVPIEARKYIPVPISEVVLDWSIIPKTDLTVEDRSEDERGSQSGRDAGANKIDILAVAIHNDTISKFQDIVTRAGLAASFFEIEIFSTMRAVLDTSLAPVMIMDMGAASTKLYIVERGVVKVSHTVTRGAQDVTQAIARSLSVTSEEAEVMKRNHGLKGDQALRDVIVLTLDYIFDEVNRVLLSFEKKYNRTVSQILLVGGGAALKGLSEHAKSKFQTEAISANAFNKLSTPAFLEEILQETGPEFAVAIGLALRKLAEETG